jgi:hypothetical protein
MQPLASGLQDENAANRQAAAYGVGVAAQKGGAAWADFVAASIPSLFQVTQHPQNRTEEHVFATENASASIAKILHFNASKVQNPQEIVNNWIETLPITYDEEAAPYAYSFIVQLVDQYVPLSSLFFLLQNIELITYLGKTLPSSPRPTGSSASLCKPSMLALCKARLLPALRRRPSNWWRRPT